MLHIIINLSKCPILTASGTLAISETGGCNEVYGLWFLGIIEDHGMWKVFFLNILLKYLQSVDGEFQVKPNLYKSLRNNNSEPFLFYFTALI